MDVNESSDVAESIPRRSVEDLLAEMRARNASSGRPTGRGGKVRPWVRYWARMIDVGLFSIPVGLIAFLVNPAALDGGGIDLILVLMTLNLWIFAESGLLATWGTTPGKALLRVQITDSSGKKLRFQDAVARSARVWFSGLGAGIPVVSVITMLFAYQRLSKDGETRWDHKGEIIVSHGRIGGLRILIAATIIGGMAFAVII